MLTKLKNMLIKTLEVIGRLALFSVGVGCVIFLSFKAPEFFDYVVRNHIGSRVYMLRQNVNSGGGTGFAVKAPSGRTFILTNDHVCESSKDGTLLATDDKGGSNVMAILERSNITDLCLLTAPINVKGLEIAKDKPVLGQKLMAVGHPALYPLVVSYGVMVIEQNESVVLNKMSSYLDGTCNLPKNKIEYMSKFNMSRDLEYPEYEKGYFCEAITKLAYQTTITILPGNSGSPLLNMYGKVVGVIFANNASHAFWGSAVSLHDIKEFLKDK